MDRSRENRSPRNGRLVVISMSGLSLVFPDGVRGAAIEQGAPQVRFT